MDDQFNKNKMLSGWAVFGNLDRVKTIIRDGADIHAFNDEALRWAREANNVDVVVYLESKIKGEENERNKSYKT